MSAPLAVSFYDVVLFVHVASVVVAFGVTFAYPHVLPWLQRNHPRAMATAHEVQSLIGSRIIGPFATLALLSGIYLAADRDLFSETWVTIPLTILIILLIAGPAFFVPRERELARIARRDVDADGALSAEYAAKARILALGGALSALLVLIALFLMVVKP
jgi:quinol-cytochrome oxidoreductase complex cytochrome b subunit